MRSDHNFQNNPLNISMLKIRSQIFPYLVQSFITRLNRMAIYFEFGGNEKFFASTLLKYIVPIPLTALQCDYISRSGRLYLMQLEPRQSLAAPAVGHVQCVECVDYRQRQLEPTLIKVHEQPPTKCSLRMYALKPSLTANYNKFHAHPDMVFDHPPVPQFAKSKNNVPCLERMSIGSLIIAKGKKKKNQLQLIWSIASSF